MVGPATRGATINPDTTGSFDPGYALRITVPSQVEGEGSSSMGASRETVGPIVARELRRIREALVVEFEASVPADEVRRTFAAAADGFAGASIHTFIPILVERAARSRLSDIARRPAAGLDRRAGWATTQGVSQSRRRERTVGPSIA